MMPPEGRLTLPPARSMNLRRHTVRSIAILQYDHRRLLSRWRARWYLESHPDTPELEDGVGGVPLRKHHLIFVVLGGGSSFTDLPSARKTLGSKAGLLFKFIAGS